MSSCAGDAAGPGQAACRRIAPGFSCPVLTEDLPPAGAGRAAHGVLISAENGLRETSPLPLREGQERISRLTLPQGEGRTGLNVTFPGPSVTKIQDDAPRA
jgi:hypothetical protein